jgi:hypothetical protein
MRFSRLWDRPSGTEGASQAPRIVDGGQIGPLAPWARREDGVREVRHYGVRPGGERDVLSGSLLSLAGLVITAALAGAGYVAYDAQRLFALANDHGDHVRAAIIGALPDAGWASMALVALVAALRGRSSIRARVGVLIFFGLSLGAQLLYAPHTPGGYLVAMIAPTTLAWCLESFVVEVRRWVSARRGLALEEAPVLTGVLRIAVAIPRSAVGLLMWVVRLCFDGKGTWGGVRDWVLDEAPIAPGRTASSLRAEAAVAEAGSAGKVAQTLAAEAATQVERERAEAARLVGEARDLARAEVERVRHDARLGADAAAARSGELAAELDQLRQQYDQVLGAATSKARLIAAYEQLGRAGDPRYGDRERVGEVARELYAAAGLRSDGTARAYLGEYLGHREGALA